MATRTTDRRAAQDLARWRREQLSAYAFPLPLAARVAKDPRYHVHGLIEFVERGRHPTWRRGSSRRSTSPGETPA